MTSACVAGSSGAPGFSLLLLLVLEFILDRGNFQDDTQPRTFANDIIVSFNIIYTQPIRFEF